MKWFDIKNKNYWRVTGDQDYSIQEVSKITGITVRSLRNYLKTYESLLEPRRGYYNSLIFSAADVQAFVMIKTLIKDGFKQSEIVAKVTKELDQLRLDKSIDQKEIINPKDETSAPVKISINREEDTTHYSVEKTVETINIPPALLENLNDTFLSLEKRNAILEEKLSNIEGMLLKLNNSNQTQSSLPRPIISLFDSTQALWSALKKSIP
tara:strand:+ start:1516 stop:2145 length:630 start_codon:yes stop_codon:yes gene_type:complete